MPKRPHLIDDALRGERFAGQPDSRQIRRIMDRIVTPGMSGRRQSIVEMEIRDEIARRRGNRIRWPF